MSLSERIRPDVEAAKWVCEEVKALEKEKERLRNDLTETRKHIGSFFRKLKPMLGHKNWPAKGQSDFHTVVLDIIKNKIDA